MLRLPLARQNGVFMDGKISTGAEIESKGIVPENGIIQSENKYDPHADGHPTWSNMT